MKKRKVIIDCDPGIDDSLAIMLALKSPEIEVIGITIVCGNSPVEMGFGNAKKILKQMNRLDVPVYIGESTPLRRDYSWRRRAWRKLSAGSNRLSAADQCCGFSG